ncbi:hypothetical protein Tsp_00586 [Trichinella spiralis]|uniref:hypothetical protein n=1 Tax=Trichinella spiralis TaxID=6334 RepID=UPI0001EFC042|nr:hypothetical protein Tsp_00586 [Trichinella spiralis]
MVQLLLLITLSVENCCCNEDELAEANKGGESSVRTGEDRTNGSKVRFAVEQLSESRPPLSVDDISPWPGRRRLLPPLLQLVVWGFFLLFLPFLRLDNRSGFKSKLAARGQAIKLSNASTAIWKSHQPIIPSQCHSSSSSFFFFSYILGMIYDYIPTANFKMNFQYRKVSNFIKL